jgi:hypothetical protein
MSIIVIELIHLWELAILYVFHLIDESFKIHLLQVVILSLCLSDTFTLKKGANSCYAKCDSHESPIVAIPCKFIVADVLMFCEFNVGVILNFNGHSYIEEERADE